MVEKKEKTWNAKILNIIAYKSQAVRELFRENFSHNGTRINEEEISFFSKKIFQWSKIIKICQSWKIKRKLQIDYVYSNKNSVRN